MFDKFDPFILTQSGIVGLSCPNRLDANEIVLKKQIGYGAYSHVHVGVWQGQEVAVKCLTYEKESFYRFFSAFKKERDLMQKLTQWQAPNLLRIFGYSYNNTADPSQLNCQIVMEYMEHGSLIKFIGKRACTEIDWSLRFRMMHDMTRGVAFLHYVNLLHGDLKVDNALVNKDLRVKIGDLGTAKNPDSNQGNGTYLYQAPEQSGNGELPPYTDKADVYSLGIMLWSTAFWEVAIHKIAQLRECNKPPIPDKTCPVKVAKLITWALSRNHFLRASSKELLTAFDSGMDDASNLTKNV